MFENNFFNPLGLLTLAGLNLLPLYVYVTAPPVLDSLPRAAWLTTNGVVGVTLTIGRACALIAELHFIRLHMLELALEN